MFASFAATMARWLASRRRARAMTPAQAKALSRTRVEIDVAERLQALLDSPRQEPEWSSVL